MTLTSICVAAGDAASDTDLNAAMGYTLYELATNKALPNPTFLGQRFAQSKSLAIEIRGIIEPYSTVAQATGNVFKPLGGYVSVGHGEEDVDIAWDAVAIEMRSAIELYGKRYTRAEALEVVKRHTRVMGAAAGAALTGAATTQTT